MEKQPLQNIKKHKPVLVDEVLAYLNPQPGKTYLDVTFGSGGHTRAILEKEPTCRVVAMDWDEVALEQFGEPLQEEFGDRLRLVWGNFALLYRIVKRESLGLFDGILADFGTSQIQIAHRPGFSFNIDTPLDMRMSPSHQVMTAYDVIRKSSEQKLQDIFWQLGEERHARAIARAIAKERGKSRLKTTKQLADLVARVVPFSGKHGIHPATRVFQALRIYVNKELDNINAFLAEAVRLLKPDGRLVCISFHSLEDRIVKQFFEQQKQLGQLLVLTPKVVMADEDEVRENPSSRSARLRAAQLSDREG